ncbi:hypothetical protein CDL15_Pgr008643 [Punica granatum]|uniref:Uncharacterized protein n=1 Tax=Punica granatum TaxID=22663 RepID=A0A218XEK2_PUNGR|nr:hypothetical protein CDL15_Pgr008643 [Punica granatum]
MLSCSFRAKNDLLDPIQVRFPSFLVFSRMHEVAPHFGPSATYTRIPGQSPDYYSSPDNRRRACGHGIMKYRRGAWSTKKTGESNQKGKQTISPEATGAGTTALFIIESPMHQKVPNMRL